LALLERTKRLTGVDLTQRPGFAGSLVPVVGSAREAIVDYAEGNYLGATANAALALSDLAPGAFVVKGLGKAGVKAALKSGASRTWGATRGRMARAGHFKPGEQGHHWLIPNGRFDVPGLGNIAPLIPNSVRNHPANIKVLPAGTHKRIHSNDRQLGLPRFTPVERIAHGTPTWAKLGAVQAGTVPGRIVERSSDSSR
jgi:hypothetical protein